MLEFQKVDCVENSYIFADAIFLRVYKQLHLGLRFCNIDKFHQYYLKHAPCIFQIDLKLDHTYILAQSMSHHLQSSNQLVWA